MKSRPNFHGGWQFEAVGHRGYFCFNFIRSVVSGSQFLCWAVFVNIGWVVFRRQKDFVADLVFFLAAVLIGIISLSFLSFLNINSCLTKNIFHSTSECRYAFHLAVIVK